MYRCPSCNKTYYAQASIGTTDVMIGLPHAHHLNERHRQAIAQHATDLRRGAEASIVIHDSESSRPDASASLRAPARARDERVLVLDPSMYLSLQRALHDGSITHEIGGTLRIRDSDGMLVIQQQTKGGGDSVRVPTGLIMFHTHPSSCGDDRGAGCALGMPSFQDVRRFHIDSVMHDCALHYVFAKDGTYVVSVRPEAKRRLRMALQRGKRAFERAVAEYVAPFERMQTDFEASSSYRSRYPAHRKRWLRYCNHKSSLQCLYFPQKHLPVISTWSADAS